MPQATPERKGDKIPITGGYQYNAYHNGNAVQRFWHFAKIRQTLDELAPQPGDRILDAGCGSGVLTDLLAKEPGAEVWGADANPSAIEFCNRQYSLPNLRFLQSLIDELPFGNNSFTKIALLEVIEHITPTQSAKVLADFNRLLSPGGTLVITTPNKHSLWPLIEFTLDTLHLVPTLAGEQHETLYTGPRLEALASRAGFECTARKTINFLSPWLAPISWKQALKLHALEAKTRWRIGSLLLYTFRKPGNPTSTPGDSPFRKPGTGPAPY